MVYSSKLFMIAVSIFSTSYQVLASPSLASSHLAIRQSNTTSANTTTSGNSTFGTYTGPEIGLTCTDACANYNSALNSTSCGSNPNDTIAAQCVCTNTTVVNLANCMTCVGSGTTVKDAQAYADLFQSTCKSAGITVAPIVVSGALNGAQVQYGMLSVVAAAVLSLVL